MIKERARFEVLLEEMRDKLQILAEGHSMLNSNMDSMRTDIKELRQGLRSEMKEMEGRLNYKIDHVHSSLKQVHSSLKNEINVTYMALNEKIEDHIKQPSHTA
jgi:phage tail tape-measure protein